MSTGKMSVSEILESSPSTPYHALVGVLCFFCTLPDGFNTLCHDTLTLREVFLSTVKSQAPLIFTIAKGPTISNRIRKKETAHVYLDLLSLLRA